nr:uncharacterized protein LOC107451571 [Parasteatoda tepidariorum]
MSDSEVQFIKTSRGGHLLLYKHNLYRIQYNKPTGVSYWKCAEQTDGGFCKSRVVFRNGVITRCQEEHNHPPNIKKLTRMAFYNKLKSRCETESSQSLSKLYKEEVAKFAQTVEVASCLPSIQTIQKPIKRYEKKTGPL